MSWKEVKDRLFGTDSKDKRKTQDGVDFVKGQFKELTRRNLSIPVKMYTL